LKKVAALISAEGFALQRRSQWQPPQPIRSGSKLAIRYAAGRCHCESVAAVATGCGAEGQSLPPKSKAATFSKPLRMPWGQDHDGRGELQLDALRPPSAVSSSPSAVLPHTIIGRSLPIDGAQSRDQCRQRIRADIEFQIAGWTRTSISVWRAKSRAVAGRHTAVCAKE